MPRDDILEHKLEKLVLQVEEECRCSVLIVMLLLEIVDADQDGLRPREFVDEIERRVMREEEVSTFLWQTCLKVELYLQTARQGVAA